MARQDDLGRLVRLAAEFDDGERRPATSSPTLRRRFGASAQAAASTC